MKRILLLLAVLTLSPGFSQSEGFGNWIMYFGQNKLSEKLSLHTEIQYRNHDFALADIEQLLIRTGLNVHLNPNWMITAGYAYIPSYRVEDDFGSPVTEESRVWQQLIHRNNFKGLSLEHRFRTEQRWIGDDYKGRFRYRLMATVPFGGDSKYFFSAYDEIFLDTDGFSFDRNRLYAAIGRKLKPSHSMQVGILNQALDNGSKWYFQLAFFINPDWSKK